MWSLDFLRSTSFRLTLLVSAFFVCSSALFLTYVYVATAGEVIRRANFLIERELISLDAIFRRGGEQALNEAVVERAASDHGFVYLLSTRDGRPITGTVARSPSRHVRSGQAWSNFFTTGIGPDGNLEWRPARAVEQELPGGWRLLVGVDTSDAQAYVNAIAGALWGAGAIVLIMGIGGGMFISRKVTQRLKEIEGVVSSARSGNLAARARVRGGGDEFDELSFGLNEMLLRLQESMSGLRHAGDAIAHDLRSPLTRLRTRLEASQLELRAGRVEPELILQQAIDDTDTVLRTFSTVLSISRLEGSAGTFDIVPFDLSEAVETVSDLYAPSCEQKSIDFKCEATAGLRIRGSREFVTQAVANLLDNAIKYTPDNGAITVRVRRRASGDSEVSVTDTGPGIPIGDRMRVVDRFVRLQSSRTAPGMGLGLSLVMAVMRAHGGQLELEDGPAALCGLRAVLVFPKDG